MQGFNMGRYVPPDVEGTTTGNKLHKKKLPSFARDGTQTVRFEMPFAVWCQHCPKPTIIGQGVRFNATKRKVGAYHSTPVFAFRMRHADCGGAIEIRTDPQHTTYAVVEGAKKRDTGEDGGGDDLVPSRAVEPILMDKERENLRSNAFAKLEKTIEDRQVLEQAKERIGELEDESARRWEDPYERNRALRAAFRVGRHERERDASATEDLRERMSLGMDLQILPASEEDARRAALVDFDPSSADGSEDASMGRKALAKPLFFANQPKIHTPPADEGKAKKKRLKSEVTAAQMRDNLVSEIVGNTRVAQDPFLSVDRGSKENTKSASRITSIKRKRPEAEREPGSEEQDGATVEKGKDELEASKGASLLTTLVEYDSD